MLIIDRKYEYEKNIIENKQGEKINELPLNISANFPREESRG